MQILAVALLMPLRPLPADDQKPAPSEDYKIVNADAGDNSIPVRVREQKDPFRNVSTGGDSAGKYDPTRIFSATSSMANKSFTDYSGNGSAGASDYNKKSELTSFATKPYALDADSSSVPNLHTKPGLTITSAYTHGTTDFDKPFPTSVADVGQNQSSALASTTASEQGRSAVLGGKTIDTYASSLTDKSFEGDEAQAAQHRLTRLKSGQMLVQDLPDRPLTVDEVRNLINHGFEPETGTKPEAPSKPLNDPGYQPVPLRATPAPPAAPVSEDDKNDPVPPPGTMAVPPPENAQPLPQP